MTTLAHLTAKDTVVGRLGELFAEQGHELWLVGGAVRDDLMGRDTNELDFATSALPAQTKKILAAIAETVWLQGERFGTIGASVDGAPVEITTFRSESYDPESRKPAVSFGDNIHDDLSRRDFTINAIAVSTPTGEVLDPFGGVADLLKASIRTPQDPVMAFTDDPLRMLRACRFAATLSTKSRLFHIDDAAKESIAKMASRIGIVSAERVRDELSKLLVGTVPSMGLAAMTDLGLAGFVLPELPELRMQEDPVNRHKDVFLHTLAVIERVSPSVVMRLAALMHDIGKPATREFGPSGVSFHHHEVVGERIARKRMEALRYPTNVIDDVCKLVFLHLRFYGYGEDLWTDSAVRRYVRDADRLLDELNELVRADCTTKNKVKAATLRARMEDLESRIKDLRKREEIDSIRPEVDGHDVMALFDLKPSRLIGAACQHMLEFRLEHGMVGRQAAYTELAKWGQEQELVARDFDEAMKLADEDRPETDTQESTSP